MLQIPIYYNFINNKLGCEQALTTGLKLTKIFQVDSIDNLNKINKSLMTQIITVNLIVLGIHCT